jgi:hypothetical protein
MYGTEPGARPPILLKYMPTAASEEEIAALLLDRAAASRTTSNEGRFCQ